MKSLTDVEVVTVQQPADVDGETVLRAKRGDKEAFEKIVRSYYPRVNRFFSRGVSREEAEDLTQEVFVRVVTHLADYEGRSSFSTWLMSIAKNVHNNALRSRHSLKREGIPVVLDREFESKTASPDLNPEEQFSWRESGAKLRLGMSRLPKQMKICAELRYFKHLRYREIAVVMGIELTTVKSHLHEARQKLAAALSEPQVFISHNADSVFTSHNLESVSGFAEEGNIALAERFLFAKHAASPHTCSAYRRHLESFLRQVKSQALTASALASYRTRLLSDGRGPSSHRQALAAVRGFLIWLAKTRAGITTPGLDAIRRFLKAPLTEAQSLPSAKSTIAAEEAEALFVHSPTARDSVMLGLFLGAGLRVGEMVGLEVRDFQHQGQDRVLRIGQGKRSRTIPLPANVAGLVESYLAETDRTWKSPGVLLLPLPHRGGRLSRNGHLTTRAIEYRLRHLLDGANITEKTLSPQSLRQTYAARFLQSDGDLTALQKLLGHASIATTELYRRHVIETKIAGGPER